MVSNKITFTENALIIEPKGLDKLWSFTEKLEIPFDHIKGATLDSEILDDEKGLRAPGLEIPGKWAGTFRREGEKTFFNIQRPEKAVVIQLANEHFDRLVLGVEAPNELVDHLNNIN